MVAGRCEEKRDFELKKDFELELECDPGTFSWSTRSTGASAPRRCLGGRSSSDPRDCEDSGTT
eukprot:7298768-Heterocapsa_arctica.AAC.1